MLTDQTSYFNDSFKFDISTLIDNSDNQSTKDNEFISIDGIKDTSFIQQNISIMFTSKPHHNLFNVNDERVPSVGSIDDSLNKAKEDLFTTNKKKKPVREAIEKKFRANCLSHVIKRLNELSGKKYKFYKLNYTEFTMKPQRALNRIWFKWTLEEILTVFGKKQKGGSNLKTINRIKIVSSSIPQYNEIMIQLNKSFREVISDYCHSKFFKEDLKKLKNDERDIYEQLGGDSELSYINITLDGKE